MANFLEQIARVYALYHGDGLHRMSFVFPNKRSATFFTHHLSKNLTHTALMPECLTLTDLVSRISPLRQASRFEQLFALYNAYAAQMTEQVDFERFVYWGQMLINDFDDVDRYMVSPDKLFKNLHDQKNIAADYLTDQQREVIRQYWPNSEDALSPHSSERMWKHMTDDNATALKQKFVKLWEVLMPIYMEFRQSLRNDSLASQGMLYRDAVEYLRDNPAAYLPSELYVFVGFNVLSTSELLIFKSLHKAGMADFYWDVPQGPLFDENNQAWKHVLFNQRNFPSRYSIDMDSDTDIQRVIDIVGVPSTTGQTKYAANVLEHLDEKGAIGAPDDADTAIVLPDETLLIPMVHSLNPEQFKHVNVTMGVPLRLTSVSALMTRIITMQMRARHNVAVSDSDTMEVKYFHEDVTSLMLSPVISASDPEGARKLMSRISRDRIFWVSWQLIVSTVPSLAPVFDSVVHESYPLEVQGYLHRLCDFLLQVTVPTKQIDAIYIDAYRNAVDELVGAAQHYGITMGQSSFFYLIERTIGDATVNFVGEPLHGLQVMGVLETRALDFHNVVMLSMNERVYPSRHMAKSFIPDLLRRAYGMPTAEVQESVHSYYFYRLLSRARHATLIYDSRTSQGVKNGEMSRYLTQLLYLYRNAPTLNVTHRHAVYSTAISEPRNITVPKTTEILDKLNEFRAGGTKNFSASALNTYMKCSLQFYLQYVEGLSSDDPMQDYMDYSTYGTVLHESIERFYSWITFPNRHSGRLVTDAMLEPYASRKPINRMLARFVAKAINRNYTYKRINAPLLGEDKILCELMAESVADIIHADIGHTPFHLVESEMEIRGTVDVDATLRVNVRQFIDRVDYDPVNRRLRFIDYKTGDDDPSFKDFSSLFHEPDAGVGGGSKVAFQLLFYAWVNSQIGRDKLRALDVQPLVYKTRYIASRGPLGLRIKSIKTDIKLYSEVADEFDAHLRRLMKRIFNPDEPFTQSTDAADCKFCQFTEVCRRNATSNTLCK